MVWLALEAEIALEMAELAEHEATDLMRAMRAVVPSERLRKRSEKVGGRAARLELQRQKRLAEYKRRCAELKRAGDLRALRKLESYHRATYGRGWR